MRYIFTFLLILASLLSYAQDTERTILIKGTVTDQQNEPLIGVLVYIKGTPVSNGVIGDIDGNYEIRIKESDVLVFSYLGFQKKEIKYTGKTTIDVLLEEEEYTFCDHPIRIYTEPERKADLSASSVTRIVEDLDWRATTFNSELYMNGVVSGLYVQNTGNVFQPQMGIRSGLGNVGGEVRQMVDGVLDAPYNFADAERIEVVKGAASEANFPPANAPGGIINVALNPSLYYSDLPAKITFNAWAGVQTAAALFPYNNKTTFNNYLDDAFVQHYDMKFNAKEGRFSFSGFVGYDDIKGTVKGNDAKRFTPRLSVGYNKNNLSFSQTVYYDYREQERSWLYLTRYVTSGSTAIFTKEGLSPIKDSPYKELFSASKLYYTPTNWLRAQTIFSYDWVDTKGNRGIDNKYYNTYRDYYDLRGDDNAKNNRWMWDTSVSGRDIFDYFGYSVGFSRELIKLKTYLMSNTTTDVPEWSRSKAVNTLFAKADYNYGWGQRTATAGIKQVSSSILDKNNKTIYLPTASASWKVSEESFFSDIRRFISYAKVKAGWGKTANSGMYIPVAYFRGNGYPSIEIQNLKWQVTSEFDGGISLAFLDSKLFFDAEYYHKTTSHILMNQYESSYILEIVSSDAKIVNKGWNFYSRFNKEHYISYHGNLRWSLDANFSMNRSSMNKDDNDKLLFVQNYIAPKYMYGAGGEITFKNFNFKFNLAGVSDMYLQASALVNPINSHLVKVNYVSLKSLDLAYSKRKFLGFSNNVTVYAHVENLLFKTNLSIKKYENTNFVQYPVNRMFSLGVKLTLR